MFLFVNDFFEMQRALVSLVLSCSISYQYILDCAFTIPEHHFAQKSNCEEALELLNTSLDSCKQSPLPLILFYDELNVMLANRTLHPSIMEW